MSVIVGTPVADFESFTDLGGAGQVVPDLNKHLELSGAPVVAARIAENSAPAQEAAVAPALKPTPLIPGAF